MKVAEIRNMSDDELRKLSLEKRTKGKAAGCATSDALKAQTELHERAGCPFADSVANSPYGSKMFTHHSGRDD